MKTDTTMVWFRHDLRLSDNPALDAAIRAGRAIVPVFIWSPEEEAPWQPGAASRWWLHHSLEALARDLHERGSRLILRRGPSRETLLQLVEESGAQRVVWNRRYEPVVIARDRTLKASLQQVGLQVETFNGGLLFEPWTIRTGSGNPFQVFTPFWNACRRAPEPASPIPPPTRLAAPEVWPLSAGIDEFDLLPRVDWAFGLRETWTPGTAGAQAGLERFLDTSVLTYRSDRERPAVVGTSRLSPHLHFGEISPRQVWDAVQRHASVTPASGAVAAAEAYVRQLGWREFAHHLLFHFPQTTDAPLRPGFASFPWLDDAQTFAAWRRGRTGYPIVDAGMHELWATGWMHNRVRMIAASFLVKDLLIPWQTGARWFWETLVDADLANNTLGWQWTAGCGADAAPFFRVFNPVLQGGKFDPNGDYVRQWLPQLRALPARLIHQPWRASQALQQHAGAGSYPLPIVDHDDARRRALASYQAMKLTR